MLLIGESINGTRKAVRQAILSKDEDFIVNLARSQVDAGAQMLDVNAGTGAGNEAEALEWLVRLVQRATNIPLCLDSSDPKAIEAAINAHQGIPMVNSISAEEEKLRTLLPLVASKSCKVIALCVGSSGIPDNAEGRLEIARFLVSKLEEAGVGRDRIYVDPAVFSIATDSKAALVSLGACTLIKREIPGVNILMAISNASFGLPKRTLLNRVFVALAAARKVDAVIADVRDKEITSNLVATEALLGRDPYCLTYIRSFRNGVLA